jgi:hypothetical protein
MRVGRPACSTYPQTYTDIAIGCTTSNQLWLEKVLNVANLWEIPVDAELRPESD